MPQFDFYSFVSQTFWILLFLGFFYFIILYFYLSNYSAVFKTRKKLSHLYKVDAIEGFGIYNYYVKNSFSSLKTIKK
jgi:hypothetical protein